MLEHLSDVNILMVLGVKAYGQNQAIELSQQLIGKCVDEKCLELFNEEGRIFVDLEETYD